MGEVARLMQQSERECEAMKLAMTGFRMAASHDIINRQYEQLGEHYESLGKLIGEKQAIEVVIATLDVALEREDTINNSARISNVSAGDGRHSTTRCLKRYGERTVPLSKVRF